MGATKAGGRGSASLQRARWRGHNVAAMEDLMRFLIAALAAAALTACEREVNAPELDGGSDGYTLEIRASEAEQTYLVIAPDGRTVGARAAEGASALMDSSRARALAGDPPPQGEQPPEVMSLRVPGFEVSIGAEEDADGERGRVALSLGRDGQRIEVNANEGGAGAADDRAFVRITGADEAAVREFITSADELSPAVQAQMLAELGME
jgi:hypothetical protein